MIVLISEAANIVLAVVLVAMPTWVVWFFAAAVKMKRKRDLLYWSRALSRKTFVTVLPCENPAD